VGLAGTHNHRQKPGESSAGGLQGGGKKKRGRRRKRERERINEASG
jgi:hypothetical protein